MRATLGVIAETRAWSHDGGLYVSASFGRIVDELAKRFERLVLTLPVACSPPERAGDYRLRADNVEIVPQPFYGSSLAAESLAGFCGLIGMCVDVPISSSSAACFRSPAFFI